MKRAFCCECGRPVPNLPDGTAGRCATHPESKRYGVGFAQRAFAAMKQAVDLAENVGRVGHSSVNYWSVLAARAEWAQHVAGIKGGAR